MREKLRYRELDERWGVHVGKHSIKLVVFPNDNKIKIKQQQTEAHHESAETS